MKNLSIAELYVFGLLGLAVASFIFFEVVCFIKDLKAKANGKTA